MSVGARTDRGETDFSNTLSAGGQQRTKNKKKAMEHEKPNEYEPRPPFKPHIGLAIWSPVQARFAEPAEGSNMTEAKMMERCQEMKEQK
jgi:hypothetical protein